MFLKFKFVTKFVINSVCLDDTKKGKNISRYLPEVNKNALQVYITKPENTIQAASYVVI